MSRSNGNRRMKTRSAVAISILLAAVLARTASPQESEDAIRAHIEGLHSDRGQVVCALFAAANDFPKEDKPGFRAYGCPYYFRACNVRISQDPGRSLRRIGIS